MYSWLIFVTLQITVLSAQNVGMEQQSRVLYNYGNYRIDPPTFSPVLRNPLQEFLSAFKREQSTTTPNSTTTVIPSQDCQPCSCGITNTRRRIVGGQETLKHEYPWMAMLIYFGYFLCGGSLINDRYILTAAHCAEHLRLSELKVRLLAHNLHSTDSKTVERKVARIIIANFDMYTYANDIALLRLVSPVKMSNTLRPVCLPKNQETFAGEKGIVTGWGKLSEDGQAAENLQQVVVSIISNDECRAKGVPVTGGMLCAGEPAGGKDACQGDSGGPLHVMRENKKIQCGVVSFGDGCARPDTPGVYTRVTSYYGWIIQNTLDACYCD